jgi:ABC-type transporter Mla subunit MlaD
MRDENTERIDPIGMVRNVTDSLLRSASSFVDEVVASEGFSQTLARGMQAVVTTTASARARVNTLGEFASEWLNIPTRRQLIEVARRLNHLELALDDVDAKADQVLKLLEEDGDG